MSIVDYIRCSVTFKSCKDMIDGLNKFINIVENKQAGCVVDIVRCKNMFENVKNWIIKNDENDEKIDIDTNKCGYCDIKFNVK